ncbi:inositol monophosphatase family protein [Leptothoe sp. ISB3NOV94-8A]|uniref:Inositol monophosphatase family protein n=1 Tax=Adonisia turfae CCMR0081 TaxID=2292702 RepID=A0A6M0RT34_9CYAN|nr:inositol monophosphatase family protein [Adonisia turfae]MDV3347521.1 inositol monophosphatase family protein [Leptothoe sp. LEGE 181152]NEZ59326.1 inositol monophosphatase family protein [Adonisia turfae CCMR0081]
MPTPREILEALLPSLKIAAGYARKIQASIAVHPDKFDSENFFATALTDADLSIQTFIEVTLLSLFPEIRFYGEEFEKTYNTKYFRSIKLGPQDDYLVTLDPIDGTRFYMDGHPNYQIILTVLNADGFEAVIALSPALDRFYYSLRGQGTFYGTLADDLDSCQPLKIGIPKDQVLLSWALTHLADSLQGQFEAICVKTDYSREVAIPNTNGLLTGDLTGAILAAGKFIDGGALSWMAKEMGYVVTDHQGNALPELSACKDYQWPGVVVGASPEVHGKLLKALASYG